MKKQPNKKQQQAQMNHQKKNWLHSYHVFRNRVPPLTDTSPADMNKQLYDFLTAAAVSQHMN